MNNQKRLKHQIELEKGLISLCNKMGCDNAMRVLTMNSLAMACGLFAKNEYDAAEKISKTTFMAIHARYCVDTGTTHRNFNRLAKSAPLIALECVPASNEIFHLVRAGL